MTNQTFPIFHDPIAIKKKNQVVFPTTISQVSDRTDCVREEQKDLQCLTRILATCVMVAVSKYLDTLTWVVSAMLERPPF